MNFYGLLVGLATFIIIGLFHPLVIKAEYYLGAGIWWLFALAGVMFAGSGGDCFFLFLEHIGTHSSAPQGRQGLVP